MPFSQILVQQLMTSKVVKVPAQASVIQVADLMKKSSIGSVLVTDGENLVGIVTETDIVHKAVAEDQNPHDTKVESIMSYPMLTIETHRNVPEAAELMIQNGIRHLAVMEKGQVVGMISMRDLLHYVYDSKKGLSRNE
jgi:signal-transduction protein with cAMP-binding, CBS, and nucleotidyltransferase domain